jgi:hypothetical protein
MKKRPDATGALRTLTGARARSRQALTLEEGLELIRAHRRGTPWTELARVLGRRRVTIYAILGTWALHHCQCPDNHFPAPETWKKRRKP